MNKVHYSSEREKNKHRERNTELSIDKLYKYFKSNILHLQKLVRALGF